MLTLSVDIINVISVTSPATVEQWDERNEDDVQRALYWRQALDVCTMELSVGYSRPCQYSPLTFPVCLGKMYMQGT